MAAKKANSAKGVKPKANSASPSKAGVEAEKKRNARLGVPSVNIDYTLPKGLAGHHVDTTISGINYLPEILDLIKRGDKAAFDKIVTGGQKQGKLTAYLLKALGERFKLPYSEPTFATARVPTVASVKASIAKLIAAGVPVEDLAALLKAAK